VSKRSKAADEEDLISRDDIEAKFREVTGDINDTAQRLTRGAVTGAAVALIVVLILVFLLGRSKGKKKTTLVEIVRI
jgi:hypothetical protein